MRDEMVDCDSRYLTISHEGMARSLTGAHHSFSYTLDACWDRCANF